jgi:hypothetical protein
MASGRFTAVCSPSPAQIKALVRKRSIVDRGWCINIHPDYFKKAIAGRKPTVWQELMILEKI